MTSALCAGEDDQCPFPSLLLSTSAAGRGAAQAVPRPPPFSYVELPITHANHSLSSEATKEEIVDPLCGMRELVEEEDRKARLSGEDLRISHQFLSARSAFLAGEDFIVAGEAHPRCSCPVHVQVEADGRRSASISAWLYRAYRLVP